MERIEIVARAMARHHLGEQTFASALNPGLVAQVCRGAEDNLWPSLVEEAKAVVQALDDAAAPKKDESSEQTAVESVVQPAVQSGKVEVVDPPADERGDRVSSSGEKEAQTDRSDDDSDALADLPIAWGEQRRANGGGSERSPITSDGRLQIGLGSGSALRIGLASQCISQHCRLNLISQTPECTSRSGRSLAPIFC
jgi:hypothetical protein